MLCTDQAHFTELAKELEKAAARWRDTKKNFIAGQTASGKLANYGYWEEV